MPLTLGKAKPVIARVLGVSNNSAQVVNFINEAVERLMVRGNWRGTTARYRIAVNDSKLTWPRQIETILKCNVDGSPVPVANAWYEFSNNGPGTITDESAPGIVLEDMGEACSFDDIEGTGKTIYVLSSEPEDAGTEILLQGYDENNQWIRTLVDGVYINGEYVEVSNAGAYSSNTFSNLTAVIKPLTNGTVFLYEHDTATGVNKPMAQYEHDEENPSYRRSRIPLLSTVDSSGSFDGCPTRYAVVEVYAKLKFIPAQEDSDFLGIGNLPAIKDMVMSIDKAEKNLAQESEYYEQRAVRELEKELGNYNGGKTVPVFDIEHPNIFGGAGVAGVI